jgi:hypothetical protein
MCIASPSKQKQSSGGAACEKRSLAEKKRWNCFGARRGSHGAPHGAYCALCRDDYTHGTPAALRPYRAVCKIDNSHRPPLQTRPDGIELPGGTKLFVFVRNEICVLLDEDFSRRPKIELLGMIAEKFAMHPRPHEPAIGVDVHFGDTEFRSRQIFLFVYAARGRIEFATGGVDPLDFRFRNA